MQTGSYFATSFTWLIMLKFKPSTAVFIAGTLWLFIGVFLMNLGLRLIADQAILLASENKISLIGELMKMFGGSHEAAVALIGIALVIGYFKGRFVLAKTVAKMVARISTFQNSIPFYKIWSPKFYLLVGAMITLGFLFRLFGLPVDIRGLIDLAVGAALVNGAVLYFKHASLMKKQESISS